MMPDVETSRSEEVLGIVRRPAAAPTARHGVEMVAHADNSRTYPELLPVLCAGGDFTRSRARPPMIGNIVGLTLTAVTPNAPIRSDRQ